MKSLSLYARAEVVPALQVRPATPPEPAAGRTGPRLRFDTRVTRSSRFPVEQALARGPEPSGLGLILDIEV